VRARGRGGVAGRRPVPQAAAPPARRDTLNRCSGGSTGERRGGAPASRGGAGATPGPRATSPSPKGAQATNASAARKQRVWRVYLSCDGRELDIVLFERVSGNVSQGLVGLAVGEQQVYRGRGGSGNPCGSGAAEPRRPRDSQRQVSLALLGRFHSCAAHAARRSSPPRRALSSTRHRNVCARGRSGHSRTVCLHGEARGKSPGKRHARRGLARLGVRGWPHPPSRGFSRLRSSTDRRTPYRLVNRKGTPERVAEWGCARGHGWAARGGALGRRGGLGLISSRER